MIKVSAPCKVHLLGEWAVVWGKPALLTTVDLRITVTISPSSTVIARNEVTKQSKERELASSAYLEIATLPMVARNDELQRIIEPIVKRELNLKKIPPYQMEITSQIPMGAHLGSSAAVSATYIAALLSFLKVKWDLNLINKLAYEAEKVFHGNPSGADNSTIVYGGLMWYRKESENLKIIQKLPFSVPPKLSKNFILINTGIPKVNTKQMITKITASFEKNPSLKEKFLNGQEKLTRELLTAVKDANENELIRIIRAGEKNLESIGVTSKEVVAIIRIIESKGGAAKVCGAGASSGPTGVLLCYHPDSSVIKNIAKTFNLNYFKTSLGVEGIRIEPKPIQS